MRKIKYYDRINHKMLELEVSDEVAKFLQADDRRQSRQGQKYRENVVLSLDDYSQVDGQNYLTYHELIADKKSNTIENYENKQFNKLVCIFAINYHTKKDKYFGCITKLDIKPVKLQKAWN